MHSLKKMVYFSIQVYISSKKLIYQLFKFKKKKNPIIVTLVFMGSNWLVRYISIVADENDSFALCKIWLVGAHKTIQTG